MTDDTRADEQTRAASTIPDEPADRTAIYWPEGTNTWARVLIRDDFAASALRRSEHPDLPLDATWFMPNATLERDQTPGSWAEVVATFDEDWNLGTAIVLRPEPEGGAR